MLGAFAQDECGDFFDGWFRSIGRLTVGGGECYLKCLLKDKIVAFIGAADVSETSGQRLEFVALPAHRAVAWIAQPAAEFVGDVVVVKYEGMAFVTFFVAYRANIMFAGGR